MIRHLLYELRFWRWMLGYQNMHNLIQSGVYRDSRRLIYDRYEERAPKPVGLEKETNEKF